MSGLRDPAYVELVRVERQAEADVERQAAGAAPYEAPVVDDEPDDHKGPVRSVLELVVSILFCVGLLRDGGWMSVVGVALLGLFLALFAAPPALELGRRALERRRARREARENSIGL